MKTASLDRLHFPNALEALERRQLFSQNIRVAAFGAVPNDGIDDRDAIVAALATARAGDRIRFASGQYDISSKIEVPSGVTVMGYGTSVGGTTTLRSADNDFSLYFRGDGLKVQNITFDGGALYMDRTTRTGASITNVNISSCKFLDVERGGDVGASNGAIGAGGNDVDGFQLANNSFLGDGTGTAMYIYGGDNWNIHDNEFIDLHCGIKSNNQGWTAHDITIARNYFTEFDYHSVELQGSVDGFWFTDNYYDNPRLSTNFSDNDSTFAFSLIYAGDSIDQHILRNYISAPERTDGTGVRLGFEAGQYCEVRDNYIDGTGTPWSFFGPKSYADGNYYNDVLQMPYAYGPHSDKSVITSNNGSSVKVTWNVNRSRPGPTESLLSPERPKAVFESNPTPVSSQPAHTVTYASDLAWADALNSVGPVEHDENNGGKPANDGSEISIAGQQATKGIGVAGNSTIVFNLKRRYTSFFSDIGIDDVSGSHGSMMFQLWADGKLVYDSGILTGRDALVSENLDLRNVKQLKLVTTDAGDGRGHDIGDWGWARFYS